MIYETFMLYLNYTGNYSVGALYCWTEQTQALVNYRQGYKEVHYNNSLKLNFT